MRDEVRKTGKRPREAYSDMLSSLPKTVTESTVQAEVVKNLPTFTEVQAQLCRHRQVRCTPVPDPLNIPESLQVTLRGRDVDDGDPQKNERFLLYSGQGGRLLVFCARTELEALHGSEFVVCDGTFEMCPDTAYQLYTLHGFQQEEAMPLAFALLPDKTRSTYEEMFQAIRDGLNAEFGNTGAIGTFLIDFEAAAINALRTVFPSTVVKGCSFHFRQAILRRVQQEGLKANYEDPSDGTVHNWIRQLMSMTALPAFTVPLIWTWLKCPPATGNASTDNKLMELSAYVERTWINGDFKPDLWTHFDNLGPRTTNHAEGFHSSLNSRFGVPHPSLRTFLDWLQKLQFEVQCRGIQLASGRPAKRRRAEYVENDGRLWDAKVDFGRRIASIFTYLFPHPRAWDELRVVSEQYLARCSHIFGC